jgi:hypothetical protein
VTRSMTGGRARSPASIRQPRSRAGNIRRSFRWPRRCAG